MYRTSPSNKNIILSIILLLMFLLSTGAMLPVQQGTNTVRNSVQVNSPTSNPSVNPSYPTKTQEQSVSNVLSTPQEAKVASNNAVQSVASTTPYSGPSSYNTTTVYDNGANFNEASSSLLPFAERYRINSTLNGWVNANGMSPDYVPINKLVYNKTIAGLGVINSSTVAGFPVSALRFIPNYPVTFVLTANNTNTGIVIYDSNNVPVGHSTNQVYVNIVTIVPTSQNPYYMYIVNGLNSAVNISVRIQQYVTPNFISPFMGDQGGNYSTYEWFFNSSITSFGVLAPNTLDLGTLTYNRSDTATVDYSAPNYQTYGYSSVVDNFTYWSTPVPSFFNLTSEISCNDALAVQNRCQSFLPMFFYNSSDPTVLGNGMWVPSLEQNHVFGANPQIMRFLGYFGNAPTLGVNKIIVVNSAGKTVLDLSNQFTGKNLTTPNIPTFVEQLTVGLPTQTLLNGTYSLEIFDGLQMLYSYPFSVNNAFYGNYHAPVVNFGYKTVTFPSPYTSLETAGTIVYANATDLDASIGGLQLSYTTTTNATWTTGNMIWLEPNHWGYVIPVNKANLANVSITVLESAPQDTGLRLQVLSQFMPDLVDLSYNTTTTMQVNIIPRGTATTNATQIAFVNDNTFNMTSLNAVKLTRPTGLFVYTFSNNIPQNTIASASFSVSPRNSINDLLKITSTASSTGGTPESPQAIYLNVVSTVPTVNLSIKSIANDNLYPYLNTTYPIIVQYNFTGGAPKANFTITVSGSGNSLTKTTMSISANNTYPLTNYQVTLNAPVVYSYSADTTELNANITYDTVTSTTVMKQINVYAPTTTVNLFDMNGNPLTIIYNKLVSQFSVIAQINFYNGTPRNTMSLMVSSVGGYITQKTFSINPSEIVNGQANVTLNLDHTSTYSQSTEIFKLSLTWDSKTIDYSVPVTMNLISSFSNFISMTLLNSTPLNPNSTSNNIKVQFKSSFGFPLKNIIIQLKSTDGLQITPLNISIPEIMKDGTYNISLSISTSANFSFTKNSYPISYTVNFQGWSQYSNSFSITYNIQLSSSNTGTSTNTNRQTPGFEMNMIFLGFFLIVVVKRKLRRQ